MNKTIQTATFAFVFALVIAVAALLLLGYIA